MKKQILIGFLLCWNGMAIAQNTTTTASEKMVDSLEIEPLDEILVSAQRFEQIRKLSPRQIEVIGEKRLAQLQPATLGDALINTGQVFVQKSQMGGSSPVLRGFEASRVLMVVDGVRMNNATYRAGHLQDIITIDPFILDRMEVNFGSGSTLYGSDALGGVLYFKTKEVTFGKKMILPDATIRYQTASGTVIGHAGLKLQSEKFGAILSFTQSNFGDLRMGQGKNYSDIDTFGYRSWYVKRVNDVDSIMKNNDPTLQVGTGYKQQDYMVKLSAKTGKFTHMLNFQSSQSGLIPRYDRLTENSITVGVLKPSFAVWNYSPQNRQYLTYQLLFGEKNHQNRLTIGRQQTQVGRVTRSFGSSTQRTQFDSVNMYTVNFDRHDQISKKLQINSGLEGVWNDVYSSGINKNIKTGAESITKARYADSGAKTSMISAFGQVIYSLEKTGTNIQAGVRLTQYSLVANYSKTNPWKLPYSEITFSNFTPSFDLGLTQKIGKNILAKASVNQAFRNPNVDDMTKVFDSKPGLKLLVPSPELKAERSTTFDLGITYGKSNKYHVELGVYQSQIKNLLLDQKSNLNGEDSIEFDGKLTPVYQLKNMAMGTISGSYVNVKAKLYKKLWLSGSLNFTQGSYLLPDSIAAATGMAKSQPLDHIPPTYGNVSLRWTEKLWYAEVQSVFNGEKKASSYSSSGEDNQDKQPLGLADNNGDGKADGYNPSWMIYNMRFGYQLPKGFGIQLSVENLLDLNYRYFASGMSASGRNVMISVKWKMQ